MPKSKRRLAPKISASELLRAEANRLNLLQKAMPKRSQRLVQAQSWAFALAAAWLDALGAPEKLQKYRPVK